MKIINLNDICFNCKKHFTPYYCTNCSQPSCVYCCESFNHYDNTFIHVCFTCIDHISQKIKPLTTDIEAILQSKFKKILENNIKKKLKKITLIKLNLKMIINKKHLNNSQ